MAPALASCSDNRGLLGCEQTTKVRLGRDDNPVLVDGARQDYMVSRSAQAIRRRMNSVVSRLRQAVRNFRGQAPVDQESQAGSRIGSSFS